MVGCNFGLGYDSYKLCCNCCKVKVTLTITTSYESLVVKSLGLLICVSYMYSPPVIGCNSGYGFHGYKMCCHSYKMTH